MFAVNLGLQYTSSNLVQYVGQTKSLSIIVIQTVLLLTGFFKTPTAQIQKAMLFLPCLIIGASPFFSTLALKILVLLSVRSILSKETYSMVGVRGSDFSTSFSWFVSCAVNFNLKRFFALLKTSLEKAQHSKPAYLSPDYSQQTRL
jgi:hypothetical protein